ncbi:hypothetical protein BU23DRAFT_203119 [Bimuria novae-zelandiae CBS 107.79]|uniref:Uncharacterized protein n=1 Tax=Bimuria novae-zelandiae CBS 107.79 TaxID=1447943 RepID=A0A6A5V2A3_9PLEO|nr:hypothetical protein BU23DRAFT_203119 [Bimuria novae-zelandiae CBS 107.79]
MGNSGRHVDEKTQSFLLLQERCTRQYTTTPRVAQGQQNKSRTTEQRNNETFGSNNAFVRSSVRPTMPVRSFDPKHQKTPFGSIVRIDCSDRTFCSLAALVPHMRTDSRAPRASKLQSVRWGLGA